MNYEEMSDFEINKIVAEALGMELSSDHSGQYVGVISRSDGCRPSYKHVNFCNNPSDAWPIIVEKRITLTPYDDKNSGWFATTDTSFFVDHVNPLRAAMIVFLMMQEKDK